MIRSNKCYTEKTFKHSILSFKVFILKKNNKMCYQLLKKIKQRIQVYKSRSTIKMYKNRVNLNYNNDSRVQYPSLSLQTEGYQIDTCNEERYCFLSYS